MITSNNAQSVPTSPRQSSLPNVRGILESNKQSEIMSNYYKNASHKNIKRQETVGKSTYTDLIQKEQRTSVYAIDKNSQESLKNVEPQILNSQSHSNLLVHNKASLLQRQVAAKSNGFGKQVDHTEEARQNLRTLVARKHLKSSATSRDLLKNERPDSTRVNSSKGKRQDISFLRENYSVQNLINPASSKFKASQWNNDQKTRYQLKNEKSMFSSNLNTQKSTQISQHLEDHITKARIAVSPTQQKYQTASTSFVTTGENRKDDFLQVALGLKSVGKAYVDLPRTLTELEKVGSTYLTNLDQDCKIKETNEYLKFIDKAVAAAIDEAQPEKDEDFEPLKNVLNKKWTPAESNVPLPQSKTLQRSKSDMQQIQLSRARIEIKAQNTQNVDASQNRIKMNSNEILQLERDPQLIKSHPKKLKLIDNSAASHFGEKAFNIEDMLKNNKADNLWETKQSFFNKEKRTEQLEGKQSKLFAAKNELLKSLNHTGESLVVPQISMNSLPSNKEQYSLPTWLKGQKEDQEDDTVEPAGTSSLGKPSSRQDAILIMKWFEEMMALINNSKQGNALESQQLLKAQIVHNIAIKELTRQVSVHCVERGILLKTIFDCYTRLLDLVFQDRVSSACEMANKYGKQVNELLAAHKQTIENKSNVIIRQMQKVQTLKQQLKEVRKSEQIEKTMNHRLKKRLIITKLMYAEKTEESEHQDKQIKGFQERIAQLREVISDQEQFLNDQDKLYNQRLLLMINRDKVPAWKPTSFKKEKVDLNDSENHDLNDFVFDDKDIGTDMWGFEAYQEKYIYNGPRLKNQATAIQGGDPIFKFFVDQQSGYNMTQKDKIAAGVQAHASTEISRKWKKKTEGRRIKTLWIDLWKDVEEAREEKLFGEEKRSRSFDLYNWHRPGMQIPDKKRSQLDVMATVDKTDEYDFGYLVPIRKYKAKEPFYRAQSCKVFFNQHKTKRRIQLKPLPKEQGKRSRQTYLQQPDHGDTTQSTIPPQKKRKNTCNLFLVEKALRRGVTADANIELYQRRLKNKFSTDDWFRLQTIASEELNAAIKLVSEDQSVCLHSLVMQLHRAVHTRMIEKRWAPKLVTKTKKKEKTMNYTTVQMNKTEHPAHQLLRDVLEETALSIAENGQIEQNMMIGKKALIVLIQRTYEVSRQERAEKELKEKREASPDKQGDAISLAIGGETQDKNPNFGRNDDMQSLVSKDIQPIIQSYEGATLAEKERCDLIEAVYDQVLLTNAKKNIAERKFAQIVNTLLFHKAEYPRIRLFGRFCNIYTKLNQNSFRQYQDIIDYFYKNVLNFSIQEQDEVIMIPYKKGLEHFSKIMSPLCSSTTLRIYNKKLRQMKVSTGEHSRSKLHLHGVKEALLLDQYAEFLIDTRNRTINEKYQNLKDLFQASDMDGNGYLDYEELLNLYEILHCKEDQDPNSKSKLELENSFYRYCIDSRELPIEKVLIEQGENRPNVECLPFKQFQELCLESQLFSTKNQSDFFLAFNVEADAKRLRRNLSQILQRLRDAVTEKDVSAPYQASYNQLASIPEAMNSHRDTDRSNNNNIKPGLLTVAEQESLLEKIDNLEAAIKKGLAADKIIILMVKLVSETVKRKYMQSYLKSLMPYKDMSNYYGFLAEKLAKERGESIDVSRSESKTTSKSRGGGMLKKLNQSFKSVTSKSFAEAMATKSEKSGTKSEGTLKAYDGNQSLNRSQSSPAVRQQLSAKGKKKKSSGKKSFQNDQNSSPDVRGYFQNMEAAHNPPIIGESPIPPNQQFYSGQTYHNSQHFGGVNPDNYRQLDSQGKERSPSLSTIMQQQSALQPQYNQFDQHLIPQMHNMDQQLQSSGGFMHRIPSGKPGERSNERQTVLTKNKGKMSQMSNYKSDQSSILDNKHLTAAPLSPKSRDEHYWKNFAEVHEAECIHQKSLKKSDSGSNCKQCFAKNAPRKLKNLRGRALGGQHPEEDDGVLQQITADRDHVSRPVDQRTQPAYLDYHERAQNAMMGQVSMVNQVSASATKQLRDERLEKGGYTMTAQKPVRGFTGSNTKSKSRKR